MEPVIRTLGEYELVDVDDSNMDEVFKIYSSNEEYFILLNNSPATMDNIHQDMKELPRDTRWEQKQYKAIKLNEEYIGVMDYVTEYPDSDSIYIGLLLIEKTLQGSGHGYRIMQNFEVKMKEKGFKRIRLGVLTNMHPDLIFGETEVLKLLKR